MDEREFTPEDGCFIHPTSCADEGCAVGAGTRVWHFSHLMAGCTVGRNCTIGQNVLVASGAVLGDGVKVQNNVSVYAGVVCEDGVFLGPSCVFTNVPNPRAFLPRRDQFRTTLVRRGASIGANATVVCGCTVGRYALVGAGAVVTRDVPDFALVTGVPARVRGYVCRCGEKLTFARDRAVCPACGLGYQRENGQVRESGWHDAAGTD